MHTQHSQQIHAHESVQISGSGLIWCPVAGSENVFTQPGRCQQRGNCIYMHLWVPQIKKHLKNRFQQRSTFYFLFTWGEMGTDHLKPPSLASGLGQCKSVTHSQSCNKLCHFKPPTGPVPVGRAQERLSRSPASSGGSAAPFPWVPNDSIYFSHAGKAPVSNEPDPILSSLPLRTPTPGFGRY